MSKHTSGPWVIHGGPGRLGFYLGVIDSIPDRNGAVMANSVCHVSTTNVDSDANARLIAAAPDLLDSLIVMVEMFERHIDGRPGPDDAAQKWDDARDAIARATGESVAS